MCAKYRLISIKKQRRIHYIYRSFVPTFQIIRFNITSYLQLFIVIDVCTAMKLVI